MRTRLHSFMVTTIACAVVLGGSAVAQTVPCVSGGIVGAVSLGAGQGMKNAPFSGTVETSFEQKLADGNAVHMVTRTRQARDSAGRTMTEMSPGCRPGEDGQMHERLIVNVYDPVARTSMTWLVADDNQPKVVQVFHFPDPAQMQQQQPQPSAEQLAQWHKAIETARARRLQQPKDDKNGDLGIRDFHGVSAHGTRRTETIPAGKEGNDQPLVVIAETWRSKELGLMMMAVDDDPRRGKTTTEYEELNLGEPDPSLFAAPAGYTVKAQPQVEL
jgi:hypothetical protein